MEVYPVWLRNVWVQVRADPIDDFVGVRDAEAALTSLGQLPRAWGDLFISGGDLPLWFSRHRSCGRFVTVVLPNLLDVYWTYRSQLETGDRQELGAVIDLPTPVFHDIFEYPELERLGSIYTIPVYQLEGIITRFQTVNIEADTIIAAFRHSRVGAINIPLLAQMGLQLDYDRADFWDTSSEREILELTAC